MTGIARYIVLSSVSARIPSYRIGRCCDDVKTIWYNRVDIKGGDFLWVRDAKEWGVSFGTPAARLSEPDIGVMWWNGRIVAFVEIVTEGQYRLRLQIKQSTPPPIVVDVFINQNRLFRIDLTRGDDTWAYIDSLMYLSPGIHMIPIVFVNGSVINGLDRNVYINKVSLELISNQNSLTY